VPIRFWWNQNRCSGCEILVFMRFHANRSQLRSKTLCYYAVRSHARSHHFGGRARSLWRLPSAVIGHQPATRPGLELSRYLSHVRMIGRRENLAWPPSTNRPLVATLMTPLGTSIRRRVRSKPLFGIGGIAGSGVWLVCLQMLSKLSTPQHDQRRSADIRCATLECTSLLCQLWLPKL